MPRLRQPPGPLLPVQFSDPGPHAKKEDRWRGGGEVRALAPTGYRGLANNGIQPHTHPVDFRTTCRHCGDNPLEAGEAPAYLTRGRSAHPTYGRAP